MTAGIFHAKDTTNSDGPDPDKVQGTDWKAAHVIEPGTILPNAPSFGNGADGALNFDGVATILGMGPATVGSFKVYTLTRDIYPLSVVIATGVKIFTAAWRLFCKTSIVGAGHAVSFIQCNGTDAPTAIAGGVPVGAAGFAAGYFSGGLGGGNGTGGAGATVTNAPNTPYATTANAAGGAGSAGSAAAGGVSSGPMKGGGGGASASPSAGNSGAAGGAHALAGGSGSFDFYEQMTGHANGSGNQYKFASGGGVGGAGITTGAGAGTNPNGGGGGGGASVCFVGAQTITGVTIAANGGKGGDAIVGTAGTGGAAGGGGGGGGGIVIVHYATRSDVVTHALAGAAGVGVTYGAGCFAGNGGVGTAGWVFEYNLSGDGT